MACNNNNNNPFVHAVKTIAVKQFEILEQSLQ